MQREKQPIKVLRQSVVCHLADKGVLKLFFESVVKLLEPFNRLNRSFNRLNVSFHNSILKTCFNWFSCSNLPLTVAFQKI